MSSKRSQLNSQGLRLKPMSHATLANHSRVPSRDSNPFATCWTRPGALLYRFPADMSAEGLLDKLATLNWRAAITGPHGSGKSTLLETLKPLLTGAGKEIVASTLRDRERRLPDEQVRARQIAISTHGPDRVVAIVDGYEQLGCFERWRLIRRCRRAGCGLIVTAHAPTCLPTLIKLAPDRALIMQLVSDLCGEVSNCITPEIVAASHACHGSNVREIFFDLYDRYERSRRMT